METKKINLDGLTNVLSPKEMKNVTGGSGSRCCCGMGTDIYCVNGVDINWVIDNCPGGMGGCF